MATISFSSSMCSSIEADENPEKFFFFFVLLLFFPDSFAVFCRLGRTSKEKKKQIER